MTDEELATFEEAKAAGADAVQKLLAEMPRGDFSLGNELMLRLAEGIRATAGQETFANPSATGFLVGFSHQVAGALVLLAIHQPTNQVSN